jgi:4-hydroxy-tetrahydrodipicolinate synthase
MAARISGIYTPTLVPFDDRGEIDEPELRRFLSWLIDRGVHGLYPNGSTGEFTRLNSEERRRIVRITCEVARGRVPVLAGAAEANVKETLAACEAYAGMGALAVAIVPPFYFKLAPESVYAYFAEIARHTPIDVTLYNIPNYSSPIDLTTIRRLAEFPRIIGIKDSSADMTFMMRMLATVRPARPDFSFLSGWEAMLAPMLMIGCDGGTHASSNAVPEITRRIYELCKVEGNYAEAMKWQFRILGLFDAMILPFEFPDGFRAAAELRGFRMGRGRQPMSSAQQADRGPLQHVLQCILADFGLVDAPKDGCAPRTHNVERDRISQVVVEVIKALEQRGVV